MKGEFKDSAKDKLTTTSLDFININSDSEDEIQMNLMSSKQNYGDYDVSKGSCGCLPVPFERAAPHSWIRPCFDSDILENQFKINSFKPFTKRFRYALVYVMLVSTAWLAYLTCLPSSELLKYEFLIFTQQFLFSAWILFLTFRDLYQVRCTLIAATAAAHLALSCLMITFCGHGTSTVSHFTMACSAILVIYTIFPLPPYVSLIICVPFSLFFEILAFMTQRKITTFPFGFIISILCHICVHVIGFHILIMTHVRVRGTFMKVGQRLLVRQQLEMEKQLKEKMIHSVMPPMVAAWLLSTENENHSIQRQGHRPDFGSLFRPFNMSRMENVSILFADIVGFTKMSSRKTAEEIVDILSDLFERFDDLCLENGCEKISTLGDCYYCVSGCPEPRSDHAKCCVEMGLGMIKAIREFDEERTEDVNMRVGVHTGTVLCGVVGTRRFKFDVWSNDVTFANKLESTGVAGRVHISEQTANFLDGLYPMEERQVVEGIKTFLIEHRTKDVVTEIVPLGSRSSNKFINESEVRERVYSCNKPHYLSLITDNRLKFTSLPNFLSSNSIISEGATKCSSSNSSKWSPFTRLKKNVYNYKSASVMESSLTNRHSANMDLCSPGSSVGKLESPKHGRNGEESSRYASLTSRKDSGIRSNSRRSSIQHQIYLMNGKSAGEKLTHRVSGYYTSSQSTLAPIESGTEVPDNENVVKTDDPDNLSSCYYRSRKESDLQLVRCINDLTRNLFVVEIPLHPLTLFFKDKKTEKEYRANAYKIYENTEDGPVTLSTARFNTYFDILISAFVLVCTTISLYVLYIPSVYFVVVSVSALIIESVALLLCLILLSRKNNTKRKILSVAFGKAVTDLFSKWYPWHVFGGLLVSLPIIVILTNFTCHSIESVNVLEPKNYSFNFLNTEENRKLIWNVELRDHFYTFLILIALAHFCNYAQLNYYMKSVIAIVAGIIYLSVVSNEDYQYHNKNYVSAMFVGEFLSRNVFEVPADNTTTLKIPLCFESFKAITLNLSAGFDALRYHDLGWEFLHLFYSTRNESDKECSVTDFGFEFLTNLNKSAEMVGNERDWINNVLQDIGNQVLTNNWPETVLNIIIILILVMLLNREFEISFRMSYFSNSESNKDKKRVQALKNQADWLLENIIPKHVVRELKNRAKYCENHSNVGIIFASIVNFNKLYDETYSGGKEYLRVLNELISDFDELLDRDQRFKNVDKIKTIGSTFMGASGLNPEMRKKNLTEHDHIYELMDFALAMYRVVDEFNSDLLGFNLVLRVGFNIGEVTAGVIGTSKLFYDIWGDAVNVASRMDSTGIDGRIQVPYSTLGILSQRYAFEPRGSVHVKGKGDLHVYLLKK